MCLFRTTGIETPKGSSWSTCLSKQISSTERAIIATNLVRARQVPEEDVRAVYDDGAKTTDGSRLLRGRCGRGPSSAGGDGVSFEDVQAQEEEDRRRANEYLRGEVGWA